jgi:multicomponent Na+:H+ antiporter subunit F
MTAFLDLIITLLVLAIVIASWRLVRGPSLPNRVVALDVIMVLAASLSAVFAIRFDVRVFIDITIVLALVSFVGTVAFAYFLDKRTT